MLLLACGFSCWGSTAQCFAQIADYGPAQLARQAVDIRAPYLAQMAQITFQKKNGNSPAGASAGPGAHATRAPVQTTFTRSTIAWFKPWSMANELSKKIPWDESASAATNFGREEERRQALTRLFTGCLETYEQRAKAEGLASNDLAVTFSHSIALNAELGTGRKSTAAEVSAWREKIRAEFARSPLYWTDSSKQAVHETIVITTMLAQIGYANATHDHDERAQAMFRESARKNVAALTSASLVDLRNARTVLGSD
jgi:hypothetical protein